MISKALALTLSATALLFAAPAADAAKHRGNGNGTGGTAAPDSQPAASNTPVQHAPSQRSTPPKVSHRVPLTGLYNYGDGFGVDRPGHMHQGIDLLAPKGTPIVAPHAGTVTRVAYQAGGAGYYAVLSGTGEQLDYVFMHMVKGSIRVQEGQTVKIGARIGDLGSTGASSGPHLHFEIWKGTWAMGGKPVDPQPYLDSWAASGRKASRNR